MLLSLLNLNLLNLSLLKFIPDYKESIKLKNFISHWAFSMDLGQNDYLLKGIVLSL